MPEELYKRGGFSVELEEKGGLAVVRLGGEFSEADSAPLVETLTEVASAHKGVLVNLSSVKYVPSKMIAPLVRAAAETKFLAVVVQPGSRERVFKLVGMEKALRLFTDEDEAHAAFLASGESCE